MRLILFILLFVPFSILAQQDSLNLRFADTAHHLVDEQKNALQPMLKRRAYKIRIKAFIGLGQAVSKNRLNAEYRVSSLSQYIYQFGVPEHSVYIERILTENPEEYNRIDLWFDYVAEKGKNVLYKTATFEEVDIGYPGQEKKKIRKVKKKKKKPKKVVKPYGKFNIKDFRKGQKIVIPDLIFYATRHVLERSSMRSLNHLVAIMRDKPSLIIQLQGHICCKTNGEDGMDFGTDTDNLSENRALAVCKYLVQHGIDSSRLSYRGFGSKFKRVNDQGDYGKGRLNRRVEIFVVQE